MRNSRRTWWPALVWRRITKCVNIKDHEMNSDNRKGQDCGRDPPCSRNEFPHCRYGGKPRGSPCWKLFELASESVNRIAEEHETQRREGQLVWRKAADVMSAVDSQRRISRLLWDNSIFSDTEGSRPEEASGANSERPLTLTEAISATTDWGPRKLPNQHQLITTIDRLSLFVHLFSSLLRIIIDLANCRPFHLQRPESKRGSVRKKSETNHQPVARRSCLRDSALKRNSASKRNRAMLY